MQEKLTELINRLLSADTLRQESGAKGAITKFINKRAEEIGPRLAREEVVKVFKNFENLPNWLKLRFTVGSLYVEKHQVFGWWEGGQLQVGAEEIPLHHYGGDRGYVVSFTRFPQATGIWEARGFAIAQEMPFYFNGDCMIVHFKPEQTEFWLQFGYALPCPLQYFRAQGELKVTRSIISAGWWRAWSYYGVSSKYWYLKNCPELFADFPWWGAEEKVRYEPPDDPYAAVLGGIEGE